MASERCLIYQRNRAVLVTASAPGFEPARDGLRRFAELVHSAGAYHTYRITDLSLWSAAASGLTAGQIVAHLERFGEHPPPLPLVAYVQEFCGRYGLLRLRGRPGSLRLTGSDPALIERVRVEHGLSRSADGLAVPDDRRGTLKAALTAAGYPVVDEAALASGVELEFAICPEVRLRPYQAHAVERFVASAPTGGVVLLPCGSGKTVVGIAAAAALKATTLVVTPSRTIGEQWRDSLLALTDLAADQVGVHRLGHMPRPVTILTYQGLIARRQGEPATLAALLDFPWGLIVYDEVHSLPADLFRQSAVLQSRRRLGLTATLVREDGRERDVFSLVGPTVFSMPWRDLERRGWIAPVDCVEVRVRLVDGARPTPERVLSAKLKAMRVLARRHAGEPTLVVAHRLAEVQAAARALGAPVVTGQTTAAERRARYESFRRGEIPVLVLSRVANVGVDLPDAAVLIQLSGAFGSRQEEAQRLGRLLRPKRDGRRAAFYSLVAPATGETEMAARRQRFLVDQGYRYRIVDLDPTIPA